MVRPSMEAVERHSLKLKTTIRNLRPVKQTILIKELKSIIRGLANYYQYSAFSAAFNKMTMMTFRKLWRYTLIEDNWKCPYHFQLLSHLYVTQILKPFLDCK